jgi:hypothetical protein
MIKTITIALLATLAACTGTTNDRTIDLPGPDAGLEPELCTAFAAAWCVRSEQCTGASDDEAHATCDDVRPGHSFAPRAWVVMHSACEAEVAPRASDDAGWGESCVGGVDELTCEDLDGRQLPAGCR